MASTSSTSAAAGMSWDSLSPSAAGTPHDHIDVSTPLLLSDTGGDMDFSSTVNFAALGVHNSAVDVGPDENGNRPAPHSSSSSTAASWAASSPILLLVSGALVLSLVLNVLLFSSGHSIPLPSTSSVPAPSAPSFLYSVAASVTSSRSAPSDSPTRVTSWASSSSTTTSSSSSSTASASSSYVNASRYSECVQSFRSRSHLSNDGVSLRIAMMSTWDSNSTRAMWRSLLTPWIPPPVDFHTTCVAYASGQYAAVSEVGRGVRAGDRRLPEQWCGSGAGAYELEWWSMYDNIELVFVLGVLPSNDTRYGESMAVMEAEQREYGDLLVLHDMIENMDEGKTLHALRRHSQLNSDKAKRAAQSGYSSTAEYRWDYVMKLDDDSFLHIPNLVRQLRTFRAARMREVYYGMYMTNPGHLAIPRYSMGYHAGAGYLLSTDLVAWFDSASSRPIVNQTFTYAKWEGAVKLPNVNGRGYEDMSVGQWLAQRGRWLGRDRSPVWRGFTDDEDEAYRLHHALVLNFYNAAADMYNFPHDNFYSRPQFTNGTVLVHWLKYADFISATVTHFVCRQPHVFTWDRDWWHNTSGLANHYTLDGQFVPSNEWWRDSGQSYRESRGNYTSPADLESHVGE